MRSATALKHRVRPDSERTRRRLFAAGRVQQVRERNCSIARTLGILSGCTFSVIREAFLGVRRFDKFLSELMIAPIILADRLNRLIDRGICKRRKYQDLPERYEYHLTETGKDLYVALVVMLAWGDRWLSHGLPPLQLTHVTCRKDSIPTVICDGCRKPVAACNMRYRLNYDAWDFEADGSDGRAAPGRI